MVLNDTKAGSEAVDVDLTSSLGGSEPNNCHTSQYSSIGYGERNIPEPSSLPAIHFSFFGSH
jgi:hypothetical protein